MNIYYLYSFVILDALKLKYDIGGLILLYVQNTGYGKETTGTVSDNMKQQFAQPSARSLTNVLGI